MRIEKISDNIPLKGSIVDEDTTDIDKTYSADYLNEHTVVVSPTEPITDRKKVWLQHGKNRINLPNGTYTNNDVTAVVNNGIITLNGTATSTSFIRISLIDPIKLKANMPYVYSANNNATIGTSASSYGSIRLNTGSADDSTTDVYMTSLNANKVLNYDEDKEYPVFVIRIENGITINNAQIKPQLEQNSAFTSYEGYVEDKEYILNGNNVYEEYHDKDLEDRITNLEPQEYTGYSSSYGTINTNNSKCIIQGDLVSYNIYLDTTTTIAQGSNLLTGLPKSKTNHIPIIVYDLTLGGAFICSTNNATLQYHFRINSSSSYTIPAEHSLRITGTYIKG